jgi:hypothetical protein
MKNGDIVRVKTQCVPSGLIPDKIVKLIYQYQLEGSKKWYAVPVDVMEPIATIDSTKIYMLHPEV